MYNGADGKRRAENDPNGLTEPLRERSHRERMMLTMLWQRECEMRDFLLSISQGDCDPRSKMTALTKLDELVMWATRCIDG